MWNVILFRCCVAMESISLAYAEYGEERKHLTRVDPFFNVCVCVKMIIKQNLRRSLILPKNNNPFGPVACSITCALTTHPHPIQTGQPPQRTSSARVIKPHEHDQQHSHRHRQANEKQARKEAITFSVERAPAHARVLHHVLPHSSH